MRSLTTLALALAVSLGASVAALAADMPAIPDIVDAGPSEPGEWGSNWYLRGDIGYTMRDNAKIESNFAPGNIFRDSKLDNTFSFGGGVGYNFGWLRADLTADYISRRDFNANVTNTPCFVGSGGATCSATFNGTSVAAIPILLNAYFDLGTWSGITPYVGAGIGAAHVEFGTASTTETCDAGGGGACAANTVFMSGKGASSWNFAWALMAGASYAITPNLSLDLGYRFLDIKDGTATRNYVYPAFGGTPAQNLGSIDFKDLYAHEVRVGFRYKID